MVGRMRKMSKSKHGKIAKLCQAQPAQNLPFTKVHQLTWGPDTRGGCAAGTSSRPVGPHCGIISVLVTTDLPNNHNNPTHVCKFCKKSTSPRSLAILSLLCVFSSLICHHIPISRSLMVFKAPHLKGGLHLPQPQELLRHAVPMRFGVFLNATNATLFEATGQSGS